MRILNNSCHDIVINSTTVHHPYAITVDERAFNTQAIFSDIGAVEITTEYSKRSFKCFGQLIAYESSYLIDTGGMPVIVIISATQSQEATMRYNEKVLAHLADKFETLSHIDSKYIGMFDLYSYIASILYNKEYADCCEFSSDSTPNPGGKELRDRVKQLLLPIVEEYGGIFESSIIDDDPTYIRNTPEGNLPLTEENG